MKLFIDNQHFFSLSVLREFRLLPMPPPTSLLFAQTGTTARLMSRSMPHSAFIPEAFTTTAQRSISLLMNA